MGSRAEPVADSRYAASPLRGIPAVVVLASAVVVTLGACQGGASPDGATGATGSAATTAPTAGATTPSGGATNPVWPSNFPDPQVLVDAGRYIAIATNGNGMNVQTLTSTDLVTWTQGSDAMPELGSWTTPGKVWAPEAAKFGDRWVMYYTTRSPDPEIQCIGVAVATKPEGPYRDTSSKPLVCETEQGGSIDASPFTASDGRSYLYWKNDGNAVGQDTWISVQPLSASGTALTGSPKRLMRQDLPWEGRLVEAPFVWENDGVFHLFYSANDFGSDAYAVGHATSKSPLGPFAKDPEPALASTTVAAGPGHCALFEKDGQVWMVYHAWAPDSIGSEVPGRTMWLSKVVFDGTGVTVDEPAVALTPP